MQYLRKERNSSQPRAPRWNYFKRKNSEQTTYKNTQEKVFKEFTEDDFKVIVQSAKTRIGTNVVRKVFNKMSHMSQLRIEPLCNYKAEDIWETLKRCLTVLEFKFKEYTKSNEQSDKIGVK